MEDFPEWSAASAPLMLTVLATFMQFVGTTACLVPFMVALIDVPLVTLVLSCGNGPCWPAVGFANFAN